MIQMILSSIQDPTEHAFFVQIFNQFHRLMFHEAAIYIDDPYAREDVVQNALVKAIENSTRIYEMDRCKIPAYLVIITRNEAINYLRHQNIINKHFAGSIEDIGEELACSYSLDEIVASLDRKYTFELVWPKLTIEDQILLSGKYIIGYADYDLSRILGCKESSIRMMLTRARRRAKRIMIEEGVVYEQ